MNKTIKGMAIGLSLGIAITASVPVLAEELYKLAKVNYPIMVNGTKLQSDLPTLNYNGNTYLPLRKVGEATGAEIKWENGEVKIITKMTTPTPLPTSVPTPTPTVMPSKKTLTIKEITENNTKAVVLIKVYNSKNEHISSGSGFIIYKNQVVTNYHVIDKASKIEAVLSNNSKYEINKVLKYDKDRDIAIIEIPSTDDLPYVKIGDSSSANIGDNIVAIGSPLGLSNTVSNGIISSIRPNMVRTAVGSNDLQISAPISHGSSGGALFNMFGEVIGITYAGEVEGQNLNYAIPINEIKSISGKSNLSLDEFYEAEHVIIFDNGDKYEGDIHNGYMDGQGIYKWVNGDIYSGKWEKNHRTGEGIYIFISGDKYIGGFLNDKFYGYGTLYFNDGFILEGIWVNDGNIKGEAKAYKDNKLRYQGGWTNGTMNGYGKLYNENGILIYEGNFVDGKQQQ